VKFNFIITRYVEQCACRLSKSCLRLPGKDLDTEPIVFYTFPVLPSRTQVSVYEVHG